MKFELMFHNHMVHINNLSEQDVGVSSYAKYLKFF